MKTVVEKERKWLVKAWLPSWNKHVEDWVYIEQFYSKDGWRYRREERNMTLNYLRLKKINVGKGINYEMGLEQIRSEDYYAELNKDQSIPIITKTRHIFKHDGRVFELDVFHNVQLIVLEIENVEMTDVINMPDWLKDYVMMEVTGDERFSNSKLAIPQNELLSD